MEWNVVMEKIGILFLQRCGEIRSQISADEIIEAAQETLLGAKIPEDLDEMVLDATIIKTVLDGINDRHRMRIRELAGRMGEVLEGQIHPDQEEEDHIVISRSGLTIRIKKDSALKMLTLSSLPWYDDEPKGESDESGT